MVVNRDNFSQLARCTDTIEAADLTGAYVAYETRHARIIYMPIACKTFLERHSDSRDKPFVIS